MIALLLLLGLLLYIFVARFAVYLVGKRTTSRLVKGLVIAIFVLIPTWDILPGWLYFQHLCEKEAGVKVLKAVEVGKGYFKNDGTPDEQKLTDKFKSALKVNRRVSRIFHITRNESSLINVKSGDLLAIAVDYRYQGGWLFVNLLPSWESTVCPSYPVHSQKWKDVIKQKASVAAGGD